MPKVQGGFRRGLCASQEMGELVKGVRQLTLQEQPYNLAQTTRTAAVPTWGQMKKLAVEAEQTLIQTSTPKTGVSMFLAMMAILSCQVPSVRGVIHWAYVPDPPLLHPAEWGGPSVPVYVNDTHTLGIPSNGHIRPELHMGFDYFGQGNGMPICLSLEGDVTGCLQMDSVAMASPGWTVFLKGLSGKKGKVINITPPQDLPPCEKESLTAKHAVPWKRCHGTQAVQYVLPGTNFSIYDWSQPNRTDSLELGMYKGIWGLSNGKFQYGLWKLGASMGTPLVQKDNKDISRIRPESLLYTNLPEKRPVIACVPEPYALLVGRIIVTFSGNRYQLQCVQCNLTNCVKNLENGKQVAVVHQPSFVMVPVNLTGPWYSDKGLQVWHEITGALSRPRRFIGLLIAGITALITLIASATAAAVALTQQVQTAHFVNNLSKNVSQALGTQENIDRKIEEKLNALHDMVLYLGEKVQSLQIRSRLDCHADYSWICVTSKKYNKSVHTWNRVKNHLEGIWHSADDSLDLLALHKEIQVLQEAGPLRFDASDTARNFLDQFLKIVPSVGDFQHLALGISGLGGLVLILFCLFPILMRRVGKGILALRTGLHELKLKAQPT